MKNSKNRKSIKYLVLAFACYISPYFLVAQNIKDSVCIVRQQFTPDTLEWFTQAAADLSENSMSRYARQFESYEKNCFGSGFVYVAKSGANYVVTNFHVVSSAEKASVEFESEDGELKKYENLSVVYYSKELDLALLAFPEDMRPFTEGLYISGKSTSDGDEVWSAGFPGLGGSPVWQFGKGVVTNSKARIKELIDPSVSTIIQHSASVSPGNSGGPLLKLSSGVYEVVGINTWKANYREATNFAVPASQIRSFINAAMKKELHETKTPDIRARDLKNTVSHVSLKPGDIDNYISKEYTRDSGAWAFFNAVRTAPSAYRNRILELFALNPEQGFESAVAWMVSSRFLEDDFMLGAEIEAPEENKDGTYNIVFVFGKEKILTSWVLEETPMNKEWKLQNIGEQKISHADVKVAREQKSNSASSGKTSTSLAPRTMTSPNRKKNNPDFGLQKPHTVSINLSTQPVPTDMSQPFGYGVSVFVSPWRFVGLRADIGFGKSAIYQFSINTDYTYLSNLSSTQYDEYFIYEGDSLFCSLSPKLLGTFPVKMKKFYLIPYVSLGPNYVYSMSQGYNSIGVDAACGLQAVLRTDIVKYSVFCEYRRTDMEILTVENVDAAKKGKNSMTFGIGVGF